MTQKEIGELRRHFRPDRLAIGRIYGCYVNTRREIISFIDEPLSLMPQSEQEKYIALLKKSMSGGLDKNLIDIVFTTEQVRGGDEHALLMAMRQSKLQDKEAREEFFRRVIDSTDMGDSNYVILIAHDTYDVPKKAKDGDFVGSDSVYSYIICAVCPTKELKSELQFFPGDNEFHTTASGQIIAPTELGFIFPAFDRRAANIYNALFFTRRANDIHPDFIQGIFNTEVLPSAQEQRESFERVLTETLEDECDFGVVQAVNGRLGSELAAHKEAKIPEPLCYTADELGDILLDSGVSEERVERFTEACRETLGEGASIKPENVIDGRKFTVRSGDLTVSVTPTESFLLETREVDGKKYLLIPVGSTVEVNGLEIKI
ncbi:MAG: DUF4317 domain-containing protein [Oscillospiraceae bacterium]|nr:DUF4317 domain-containing protein [Oscillospiraceae bacterium]